MAATPRQLANPWLRRLVNLGLSKSQIQKELLGVGLGYRRAVLFADIDVLKGLPVSTRAIASFPKFLTVERQFTTETPLNLTNDLLAQFRVTGTDQITGERITKFFSRSTNRLGTIGEEEDRMLDLIASNMDVYNFRPETAELRAIFRGEGEPF